MPKQKPSNFQLHCILWVPLRILSQGFSSFQQYLHSDGVGEEDDGDLLVGGRLPPPSVWNSMGPNPADIPS